MTEREVSIRKRINNIYNKREGDFECLLDYNNYLEEKEDIVFSLVEGVDVTNVERNIKAYQRANEDSIAANLAQKAEEKRRAAQGLSEPTNGHGETGLEQDSTMSAAPSIQAPPTPLTEHERLQLILYAGGYIIEQTRRRAITEALSCLF
eukprot:3248731-Pyramimonas_sp.AAC.1